FGPFTYTVVAGDNIYRISVRYGITMRELLNANPQITNMNVISEGQQITVPGPPTQLTTAPQSTIVVQPTQAVVPQQIFTPTFTPFGN
ncbi:MAG: LysM peptidoglycan-binding domain-containing protein, partial [Anaerolineae bacterium]|nr:LysM peptidoglycan-binding domain-containing protein [Anaerolineae bacterium]